MKILRFADRGFSRGVARLSRRPLPDPRVRDLVEKILAAVEREGDDALLRYSEKFGGPSLQAAQVPVSPA